MFRCTVRNRTDQEQGVSLPSPSTLPLSLHSFWGGWGRLTPRGFASSPKKEPGIQEVWESFISISYKGDLNLGKQVLVQGDGGQVLAPRGQGRDALATSLLPSQDKAKRGTIFLKAIQRVSNSWGHCNNSCLHFSGE